MGSELEIEDLKEAYLDSRGDMGKVLDAVPLCTYKDEGRFRVCGTAVGAAVCVE